MHLNELFIRNVKAPETGQKAYYDDAIAGFAVRVSQGGTKTFSLTHGQPRKRLTLGRYPYVTLAQARDKARKLIAHRMLHGDAPPDLTLDDCVTLYLKLYSVEHHRPSTQKETERFFRKHWLPAHGTKLLKDVTTADILKVTDGLVSTPTERNHAHAAIRGLLRWATRRRYIAHSPCEGLQLPAREQPRTRVLSPKELSVAFQRGSEAGLYGQLIRILILSGQRLGQWKCLKPEWVTEDTIEWPATHMKSNKAHLIPLTPLLKKELETFPKPFVFNNYTYAHVRFLRDTELAHFTRHDCRRSYATIMAQWTPPHVLDRILAHTKGSISGVAAIYNRHAYLAEMRDALLAYETWLANLSKSHPT